MIGKILGYFSAYLLYIQTPKGRHDFIDDLRAFLVFIMSTALVMALVMALVKLICEK